jgi:alpha-tubulin suppressor-like RCC1 family protein
VRGAPLLPLALLVGCSALLDGDFEPRADGSAPEDARIDADGAVPPEDAGEPPIVWSKVAAGGIHTCGLRSDGTLWCWGDGAHGQLGDGTQGRSLAPVQVLAADELPEGPVWDDWIDVSAGGAHTCGRRADHTLWCWGLGASGQRGDDDLTTVRPTPAQVVAEGGAAPWDRWMEVSAGTEHTCGRLDDGSLWCWGQGNNGRLGDGQTSPTDADMPNTPTRVLAHDEAGAPWSDWEEVSAGHTHTCGRRGNDTLWCWGRTGPLGIGAWDMITNRGTPWPVVVADDESDDPDTWTDWREVTASDRHTCGRRSDRSLWCWGSHSDGRLGVGNTTDNNRNTPIQVHAAEAEDEDHWADWVEVDAPTRTIDHESATDARHTCGRRQDGSLWCWGAGDAGRLGDADDATSTTPTQVLAEGAQPGGSAWDDWAQVATGTRHTCGLRADGSLWCWGDGEHGQRGNGNDFRGQRTPVRVEDPQPTP